MADLKISQLTSTVTPSLSDILPIVNQGSTKKISLQALQTFLGTAAYLTTIPTPLLRNNNYLLNARTSPLTATMPSNPISGAVVGLLGLTGSGANNITVNRNNQKINNLSENLIIDYSCSIVFTYIDATEGWRISSVFEI